MSTIGSLLALMDPGIKPWSEGMESVNRAQRGATLNQTELLQLAELKRQQAAEQEYLTAIQTNPALAQQIFGGSVLGSLGTPGGPPAPTGGAPMTQQTVVPGQPPGAPQPVPGGQNLSQFATQGQPGTATLASIGPQPQGPPQAPSNPLLEMARRDPRAALMLQQRMQQQQEQQLKMRATVAEGIAVELQGATDQASYDAARQRVAQISPQWAQALPQVYSKEAVQPWIDRALGAKDKAVLDVQTMQTQVDAVKAQAELQKARMGGRVAKTDQYLKALGVAPGTETDVDMQKALAWQQRDEIAVSASHGSGQVVQTPDGMFRLRPGTDTVVPLYTPEGKALQPKPTQAEQETATFGNLAKKADAGATALETKGFKPGFWDTVADKLPLGMNNYLTSEDYQSYKSHVLDFAQAWLRKTSKGAVTEQEWQMVDKLYFPQPGNSQKQIEEKRQKRASVIQELEAETKGTGRTGTQGQPTSQGTSGGATRQGGATFTDADIAATLANPANKGKTRQQVMDAALAKGLTYKER